MKKLLFKFPSRERPVKMFAAIENMVSMVGEGVDYSIQLTLDIDDKTCSTPEVRDGIKSYGERVKAYWGTSLSKVNAINRDMEFAPPFEILLLHSDDMRFTKKDFGYDILKAFENFSGLVHFPDQYANNRLITYPMMSKDYYDRFGYIYNPIYRSVYCDNEQHEAAVYLKKYKFVDENILIHEHPIWGFGEQDELGKRTEEPVNYRIDGEKYKERKAFNFYL